jgi:hypothetical protein
VYEFPDPVIAPVAGNDQPVEVPLIVKSDVLSGLVEDKSLIDSENVSVKATDVELAS